MQRPKQHLLQKLYTREIHGSFVRNHRVDHNKAVKLFNSIPDRLMFYLKDVLQHMGNHILVGTTRCGQFLITYSYATELRLPVQMHYKYRLHWWAFRPGAPAYKVAEVQLFDNQDVTYALTVGIAQWPNVNDKLIAYGYCDDNDDSPYEQEDDVESRKYYITVTTLPSLHDCKDCKTVAESFDEEEMAANWDSCIGLSCLKHGLTIHTTLEISPPFPTFDLLTNLKVDNKIIVNTGNFLHVLTFGSDKHEVAASHGDTITSAEISHRIGEKLVDVKDYVCPWKSGTSSSVTSRRTLTRSVNKAWLNTIMDQAEKIYAFEEAEDGCEPRFKWFRRRRLADKMYEFCDEELENVCPPAKTPRISRWSDESSLEERAGPGTESEDLLLSHEPKYFVGAIRAKQMEWRGCDQSVTNECDKPSKRLDCNTDCDKDLLNTPQTSNAKCQPLDISIINPDLSAILAEWEADSVSSLSPNCSESKNDVVQSFLERIPGVNRSLTPDRDVGSPHSPGAGKYSPLLVVLRTRNCNQEKDPQRLEDKGKPTCKEENPNKVSGHSVDSVTMRQRMISGCSVRFDRIYIEVDEEIISTITDIEDDDQGTGFHCALPLSVHGSAYAQLQMVSSQKAERMNIHCERVYQNSLDIEQFCFKAADTICQCEGYKFWFCNDYDVEIIDVCPLNGDILGVICLRVNAEKKPQKNERYSVVSQRYFYEVRCVFVWNPCTDRCWLEAYSRFVDVTKLVNSHWAPAKKEAAKLRKALKKTTLFSLRPFPPIRTFAHRMWTEDNLLVPSLEEIRDHSNLIGFRLVHIPRRLRRFTQFL